SVSGISVSGAHDGNNTLQRSSASGSADITPRALTVSASGVSKVYDDSSSAAVSLSSDDRVAGDDLSDAYASATFADKNAGTGKAISVSGISISGADAGNYTLQGTSASASADITPRALTVSASGGSQVYDGSTNATVRP